jgi:hypothetical protein
VNQNLDGGQGGVCGEPDAVRARHGGAVRWLRAILQQWRAKRYELSEEDRKRLRWRLAEMQAHHNEIDEG